MNIQVMKVDDIILEKMIDKGEHSEVYLSCKKGENIKYVTKKYERALVEGTEYYKRLLKERTIIQNSNHQNILKLICIKKTKKNFYVVLEYCNGGDLSTILINYLLKYGKPFSQEIVQHLMRQVISGLKYIHDKKLVHGDIKLKSILVHFDAEKDKEELNMMKATIKISHFKFTNKSKIEPLNNNNIKSKNNDIFDLGVMCYKMIFGKYGLDSVDPEKLINEIEKKVHNNNIILSKDVISFMKGMLVNENKLHIKELSNHIFLSKDIKNLNLTNQQQSTTEDHLCIYCLVEPSEIILAPCGHKYICNKCYKSLKEKNKLKICDVCRTEIESFVEKVFDV